MKENPKGCGTQDRLSALTVLHRRISECADDAVN
jgi:hypothetical protein